MSYQNPNPQPLDLRVYETGYGARLKGLSAFHAVFAMNWLHPSWRAGWADAGRDLDSNPELAIKPKTQARRIKRGN
jgi:hypothetical protein